MVKLFRKIFPTKNDRDVKKIYPVVAQINELELGLQKLSDDELRAFLRAIESDQGAILQLSPEAMDLVVAGFRDRDGVVYQSTVSMAPTPTLKS